MGSIPFSTPPAHVTPHRVDNLCEGEKREINDGNPPLLHLSIMFTVPIFPGGKIFEKLP